MKDSNRGGKKKKEEGKKERDSKKGKRDDRTLGGKSEQVFYVRLR